MQKIMFDDFYHLESNVLNKSKTQTRRIATYSDVKNPVIKYMDDGSLHLFDGEKEIAKSKFKLNEKVAIAQNYFSIWGRNNDAEFFNKYHNTAGWNNKMFTKADIMPHHIEITGIHLERLDSISPSDAKKEGVWYNAETKAWVYGDSFRGHEIHTSEPYDFNTNAVKAYRELINRLTKGIWEKNPWVFVYDFTLID